MKIYLASPFFNAEQNRIVGIIEKVLRSHGHEVFSPREEPQLGSVVGATYEIRRQRARDIYRRNVSAMDRCEIMVAVVDGNDAGTIWEMGWYAARGKPIVSVTFLLKPLNIMLQEAVVAHCRGDYDLDAMFGQSNPLAHTHEFQKFHDEMI